MSARFQGKRGLIFACERSAGVLVVFELAHRAILLEPFKMIHKGIFARAPAFIGRSAITLASSLSHVAVQHVRRGLFAADSNRR
jgi:hypothetical protein